MPEDSALRMALFHPLLFPIAVGRRGDRRSPGGHSGYGDRQKAPDRLGTGKASSSGTCFPSAGRQVAADQKERDDRGHACPQLTTSARCRYAVGGTCNLGSGMHDYFGHERDLHSERRRRAVYASIEGAEPRPPPIRSATTSSPRSVAGVVLRIQARRQTSRRCRRGTRTTFTRRTWLWSRVFSSSHIVPLPIVSDSGESRSPERVPALERAFFSNGRLAGTALAQNLSDRLPCFFHDAQPMSGETVFAPHQSGAALGYFLCWQPNRSRWRIRAAHLTSPSGWLARGSGELSDGLTRRLRPCLNATPNERAQSPPSPSRSLPGLPNAPRSLHRRVDRALRRNAGTRARKLASSTLCRSLFKNNQRHAAAIPAGDDLILELARRLTALGARRRTCRGSA